MRNLTASSRTFVCADCEATLAVADHSFPETCDCGGRMFAAPTFGRGPAAGFDDIGADKFFREAEAFGFGPDRAAEAYGPRSMAVALTLCILGALVMMWLYASAAEARALERCEQRFSTATCMRTLFP